MAKASREKGKRGELMWRDKLIGAGFPARRSAQSCGSFGQADVDCEGLGHLHQEVKFVEKLNLRSAMEQAISDAKEGKTPIVAHKTSRMEWLVTMRAEDFLKMQQQLNSHEEHLDPSIISL